MGTLLRCSCSFVSGLTWSVEVPHFLFRSWWALQPVGNYNRKKAILKAMTLSMYRYKAATILFAVGVWSAIASAHPLDEMGSKANAYNPAAPKALDVLIDMRDGEKVLIGFFVDLGAVLNSSAFPAEYASIATDGQKDPNWAQFVTQSKAYLRRLMRVYADDQRLDVSIHLERLVKEGKLSETKRDFVEIRARVQRTDKHLALAVNPTIESVRVGVLKLGGNQLHTLDKDKGYVVAIRGKKIANVAKNAPQQMLKNIGDEDSILAVVWRYLELGFVHILPAGVDHILFVLGLFFFAAHWKPLLVQVSLFTAAHTITLAMATLGVVNLSPNIVEPLIALSIVYIAIENVFTDTLKRSRMGIIFGFGLLHGLGFAGVLAELGLEKGYFVTSLISFNVGVEVGQLAVLGCAFAAVGWFRKHPSYRRICVIPASLIISAVGLYWTVERVFIS